MFPLAIIRVPHKQPANAPLIVRENPNDYAKKNKKMHKNTRPELLKRIALERLMDLKVDYAFKQLFGNEKNKTITVVFLNAILQKTGRKPIKDISFTNIEIGGEYEEDKQSRLDLIVVTDDNEQINVEVQFTNEHNMIKRSLFYWSRLYTLSQQKSMDYKELRPVITINILNFDLFSQTKHFHKTYHLYEDKDVFQLTDVMEIHFIEMGKLIKTWKNNELNPWSDLLARWLLMLGMVDQRNKKVYDEIYHELEAIAVNDKTLRDAFHNWEELSMTQEQRLAYESRLKVILDQEDRENRKQELEELEKKAAENQKKLTQLKQEVEQKEQEVELKEQEVELKEEEINRKAQETERKNQRAEQRLEETARKLLDKGMDIKFIAEATNLSWDKIVEISKGLKE